MSLFDGTQKEIGRGAQAIVYYYEGFAYKVYHNEYPKEWIQREISIQSKIKKTNLPVVEYYETADSNIIKMDFISGMTLGERMRKEKYKKGVEDIISMQKSVHAITGIDLPDFKASAVKDILGIPSEQKKKDKFLAFLDDIPDMNHLLHLDFHLFNIMFANRQYYIIDWINAKSGNPVFDYARSYVLLNEFAYRLSKKYLSYIEKDEYIDTSNLKKAIYIMAMLRIKENCSDKTLELITGIENEILS